MSLLAQVIEGKTLTRKEAEEVMDGIVALQFPADQIGKFLLALRSRGEKVEEIAGFATSIRKHARPFSVTRKDLIDTCGTGGDGGHTFNISTAVALVVASQGLAVAKHGNRSVSSRSGSADVYEALGFKIEADSKKLSQQLEKLGFAFLYAPHFHPAMGSVGPIRKSLGVRTVFNILGPLVNPASVKRQVIGVYDRTLLEKMAAVLRELGSEEALIVCSKEGLDELSVSSATEGVHLKGGKILPFRVNPEEIGLHRAALEDLRGGTATENAEIILKIFGGERGPRRDVVALNAAAGFWIGGAAKDIREGLKLANSVLNSGKPSTFLNKLKKDGS